MLPNKLKLDFTVFPPLKVSSVVLINRNVILNMGLLAPSCHSWQANSSPVHLSCVEIWSKILST